jgi:hypothetical protein
LGGGGLGCGGLGGGGRAAGLAGGDTGGSCAGAALEALADGRLALNLIPKVQPCTGAMMPTSPNATWE